jgi:hypothetical protein
VQTGLCELLGLEPDDKNIPRENVLDGYDATPIA